MQSGPTSLETAVAVVRRSYAFSCEWVKDHQETLRREQESADEHRVATMSVRCVGRSATRARGVDESAAPNPPA